MSIWSPSCKKIRIKTRTARGNTRGWALLEVLLVLPMIMLLAGLLGILVWNGTRAFGRVVQLQEGQYYARTALQMISDDVAQARQAYISNNGQVLDLNRADGLSKRYYLSGEQIYQVCGSSTLPLTEDTSRLSFSFIAPGVVQAEIIQGSGEEAFRLLETCALSL